MALTCQRQYINQFSVEFESYFHESQYVMRLLRSAEPELAKKAPDEGGSLNRVTTSRHAYHVEITNRVRSCPCNAKYAIVEAS